MNYQLTLEEAADLEAKGNLEAAYLAYDSIYEAVVRAAGDYAKVINGALTDVDGKKTMTQLFFDEVNTFMSNEPCLRQALYNMGRLHFIKGERNLARQFLMRATDLTPADADFPELRILLSEIDK